MCVFPNALCCSTNQQVEVAARPRNHLYRTSKRIVNGAGNGAVFVRFPGQIDHLGNIADQFDFDTAPDGGPEDHLIDQGANDFDCFGAGGVVVQEVLKGGDLALIQGSKVGMETHRFVQQVSKLFRDLALAGLQGFYTPFTS